MDKKIILLLLISIFIISSTIVLAEENVIENVLSAIAGDKFDITSIYNKYGMFIDLVIYLLIFLGITKMSLGEKFKHNQPVIIGIGLVLALSLAWWGNQPAGCRNVVPPTCNFTIASFGPFAGAVFVLLIFVAIYELIKVLLGQPGFSLLKEKGWPAIIAIVVVWYASLAVAPKVIEWVVAIPVFGSLIKALIGVLLILAIIGLVILIKDKFK